MVALKDLKPIFQNYYFNGSVLRFFFSRCYNTGTKKSDNMLRTITPRTTLVVQSLRGAKHIYRDFFHNFSKFLKTSQFLTVIKNHIPEPYHFFRSII